MSFPPDGVEGSSYEIHGVKVVVYSPDDRFCNAVNQNLCVFPRPNSRKDSPLLEVYFDRYYSGWRLRDPHSGHSELPIRRLGTDLYVDTGKLLWQDRRFHIKMSWNDGTTRVTGHYRERRDHAVRRLLDQELLTGNYMSILRHFVFFPLFQIQEDRFGRHLLHGATVEKDGQALAFVGFNGSGKSTLATYLQRFHGWNCMSDNFVLFDSERVYGFPEVKRLSLKSVQALGMEPSKAMAHGKYHLDPGSTTLTGVVRGLVFVTIGDSLELQRISPLAMVDQIERMHDYIKEFHNYSFTAMARYADYKTADHSAHLKRHQALEDLCHNTACWSLTLPPLNQLNEVAKEVLDAVLVR